MKIILLFGPTAVGKTELISRLFKENYEIINADSLQVYRTLDIGTAKPSLELLKEIPHHLIDIISPKEQFHAGEFVRLTDTLAQDIANRGNIPVICGGTAFYFKNYLYGLPDIPKLNPSLRKELITELDLKGLNGLYNELKNLDPVRAEEVHPNDKYRILRSLEIIRGCGKAQSEFKTSNSIRSGITPLILGLKRNRTELYSRIDQRVDKMFEDGFIDEIKQCFEHELEESDPGMQGIGYREFFLMAKSGEISMSDTKDLIKMNSRRYAKRQITFFGSLPDVRWYHPDDVELIQEKIAGFLD
ncbi:MAG: tRNA (adenosine(37)-N6)-dimethylallyltransferase MiaA [Spirochaetia bacterium]|jgi:tRNA dimethylallyltransferase|nr:tRNA (adenosine(37)-N6)-dimethylallyltransferase MiaA [Spirochaetia bacterium]